MSPIETFDGEIARLQAELARVESAPLTIAERFAAVEAELRGTEDVYRRQGLRVFAVHPGEAAHLQRQVMIGMVMAVSADQILAIEHARITAQGEGLSESDKAAKRAQLHAAIRKAAAQRELAVREIVDDFTVPRPVYPELVIFRLDEVRRLASMRT